MPIYEYCCQDCKQIFEEWQEGFEEKELTCPVCSGPAKRVISHTAFILKGSGWYVTDYAGKKPGTNGNGKSGSDDGDSSAPAPDKAETRNAGKAPDKASGQAETGTAPKGKAPDHKSTG